MRPSESRAVKGNGCQPVFAFVHSVCSRALRNSQRRNGVGCDWLASSPFHWRRSTSLKLPQCRSSRSTDHYQRLSASSSASRAETQRLPASSSSFFQNGARDFKKSITNAQAARAASRWALAAPTQTISSAGRRADAMNHRDRIQRPALSCVIDDFGNRGLRHTGIVLEIEYFDCVALV